MTHDPHPADADYSALHMLSDDSLEAMVDSAMAVAEMLGGQGGSSRRFRPADRGILAAPPAGYITINGAVVPTSPSPPTVTIPDMKTTQTIFTEAAERARAEPVRVSAVDAQMIGGAAAVLEEWSRRLRELPCATNPVIYHALNSLDLARLGLAKAIADDGPDRPE